ncbi:hydrogenase-1 operon protein HyaE [Solimonas aquatica]|uniref:Hydrogenase expression/formation protein n=1 Tax=Solimonas aquatica TaxID=489703 RepID=A0A1H9FY17_9GAMM|nr:hypothetical protein [Solimonas aquatica]SEQ42792.1 hydrogenase-1 operon protein HyaE [Solimonas aquatica]
MNLNDNSAMFASTANHQAPLLPAAMQRLAESENCCWVSTATLAEFLAQPGDAALLIWSDPVKFPECIDVAVVLPELRSALSEGGTSRFRVGVVARGDEFAVGDRFGALRRPSLVFLRDGQYVATIPGMRDWDVFLNEARAALQAPPTRPPSIAMPARAATVN